MRTCRVTVGVIMLLVLVTGLVAAKRQQIFIVRPENQTTELDGSQPSYVCHGWVEPVWALKEMGYRSFRSFIEAEGICFYLSVDGEWLDVPQARLRYEPASPYGEPVWVAMWQYNFRPRELSQGIHVFDGYFMTPQGPWHIPQPAYVNVTYP